MSHVNPNVRGVYGPPIIVTTAKKKPTMGKIVSAVSLDDNHNIVGNLQYRMNGFEMSFLMAFSFLVMGEIPRTPAKATT